MSLARHPRREHFVEPGSPRPEREGKSAMERARQQQTVAINRGLFLVRYAAAEDTERPPIVRVSPDPAPNKDIGFLLHPEHSEPVLWQPETCLVVRALAPGKLAVEVVAAQAGGSTAATVRIEPLTQGDPTSPLAQSKGGRRSSPVDVKSFRILGHVTGLGDQFVNANECKEEKRERE